MPDTILVRKLEGHRISYCEQQVPTQCLARDVTYPCRLFIEVSSDGAPSCWPPKAMMACTACAAHLVATGRWTVASEVMG